jgi:hypothetical protein
MFRATFAQRGTAWNVNDRIHARRQVIGSAMAWRARAQIRQFGVPEADCFSYSVCPNWTHRFALTN